MIDTLQATPQAMKLMDDLITGQLELSPSVPKVLYPLIRLDRMGGWGLLRM